MEVQEVPLLTRNPLMARGILGIVKSWVQILINGGARSTSTNQKSTYGQGILEIEENCRCRFKHVDAKSK